MYIKSLPPLLCIHLKRFGYDWEANRALKFDDYFKVSIKIQYLFSEWFSSEFWNLGSSFTGRTYTFGVNPSPINYLFVTLKKMIFVNTLEKSKISQYLEYPCLSKQYLPLSKKITPVLAL